MFLFLVALVICLPIIGLALMEAGAWGPDIGSFGYPNGATQAYVAHVVLLIMSFLVIRKMGIKFAARGRRCEELEPNTTRENHYWQFEKIARVALLLQILFFIITFLLGGYKVLFLGMDKSELRNSMGPLGFFIRSYAGPMLFAFTAGHFKLQKEPRNGKWLWANGIFLFLTIWSWGYRAGFVFCMIPAMLILNVRILSWRFIFIALGGGILMISSQLLFGGEAGGDNAGLLVLYRATIGTANSAWKIWDMFRSHYQFPAISLKRFFGDSVASALGWYQRGDSSWYKHDFSAMITSAVKGNPSEIDAISSNVTASSFSTGVIMFGAPGYLIYSIFNGVLIAYVWLKLKLTAKRGKTIAQAFWATFFASSILPFLDSGDPLALATMANLIYYGAAIMLCVVLQTLSESLGHLDVSPGSASISIWPDR
jgi:hypothetical protein